jgi:hypothetical protein
MLELSIEGQDEPEKMSATDIVLSMLESVPDTLLAKGDPIPKDPTDPAAEEEELDTDTRADELLKELRRDAVRIG